jgi:hypothetical protein
MTPDRIGDQRDEKYLRVDLCGLVRNACSWTPRRRTRIEVVPFLLRVCQQSPQRIYVGFAHHSGKFLSKSQQAFPNGRPATARMLNLQLAEDRSKNISLVIDVRCDGQQIRGTIAKTPLVPAMVLANHE